MRRREKSRLREHAATIEEWRGDFPAFAAQLDVFDKSGVRIPVRPSAMLAAFEATRTGRDVVLKPRQVWFTTWELARDVWFWLTHPGSHVVVVCQSDKDNEAVQEVVTRLEVMLGLDDDSRSGEPRGLLARHPWLRFHWHKGALRFGSSRLRVMGAGASKAAAEKKGRAGTIHRLHITEISSFEHARSTMNAITKCVPDRSINAETEISVESTARGAAGLFYEFYQAAKERASGYAAHFFAWMRHREYSARRPPGAPRLEPSTHRERELAEKHGGTQAQLAWYRAKVAETGSQALVDQEYPMDEETCWLTEGRNFLDVERTKALIAASRDPLRVEKLGGAAGDGYRNELRVWKDPRPRRHYVVVADPSEGVVGGDPCAAAVYDRESGEHVATLHGLWRTWQFAAQLDTLGRAYNSALLVVERQNHGHAVLNALLRLEIESGDAEKRKPYPNVFRDDDEQPGWKTGRVQRSTAMEAFEEAHRTGAWTSPCADSLGEMLRFVIWRDGTPRAAPGAHDDRVVCHVIAWRVLSVPIPFAAYAVGGTGSRWGTEERGYG